MLTACMIIPFVYNDFCQAMAAGIDRAVAGEQQLKCKHKDKPCAKSFSTHAPKPKK